MMDGKTNGRQMLKSFIVDTGWIHTITEEELGEIKKIVDGLKGDKKDLNPQSPIPNFVNYLLKKKRSLVY